MTSSLLCFILALLWFTAMATKCHDSRVFEPDNAEITSNRLISHQSSIIRASTCMTGLSILSISRHDSTYAFANPRNATRPFWVDFSVHAKTLQQFHPPSDVSCGLQILGVMPKSWNSPSFASLAVHEGDDEQQRKEEVSTCVYLSNWVRREGLVAASTMRPVLFWCPVARASENGVCAPMSTREVNMSISLQDVPADRSEPATFTTRALNIMEDKAQCQHQPGPESVGTIVATVTHTMPGMELEIRMQAFSWIVHHLRLGLKVVLYDKGNVHGDFLYKALETHGFAKLALRGQLEYRSFSVRGVLGYRDNQQIHARSDQDKALTYTYYRFEEAARAARCRRRPPSMLVVDIDEYVLCTGLRGSHPDAAAPGIRFTVAAQREALIAAVHESRRSGKDEMVWGRFSVPNISALPECLGQKFDLSNEQGSTNSGGLGRSIFECYGGFHWREKQNTIKTMHHNLACPSTDFHFACCSACPCGKKWQAACSLMHLRPLHAHHHSGAEQMLQETAHRYASPGPLPDAQSASPQMRVELADVWRSTSTNGRSN